MVEFASNGHRASGYLATPAGGSGPGVVVIQEWWGLVPHIQDVCERFATEGFVALAPDLYDGTTTTEPDEAGKLMMALNIERAAQDLKGAAEYLQTRSEVTSDQLGVTGFCMGGGLTLVAGCHAPELFGAVVPWYGLIPWPEAEPDWDALAAPVLGHYAEQDGFFNPEAARALEQDLKSRGKDVTFTIHPGVDHAFFNDSRPEVYDPETSARAWLATTEFLRRHLT